MQSLSKYVLLLIILVTSQIYAIDVSDPKINITLSKLQYASDQSLQGDINLVFKKPVENKDLELWIGATSLKKDLLSILEEMNLPANATKKRETLLAATNEITFPPNEQVLGFSAESSTETVDVDLTSSFIGVDAGNNNFPTFPYIDIGIDGIIEWRWLGSITQWSTFTGSSELNLQESSSRIIPNKQTYVCEIVDIPHEINQINISAKFKILAPGVVMRATVLVPTEMISSSFGAGFQGEFCDLSTNPGVFNWNNCHLTFEDPQQRKGKYLICIYARDGPDNTNLFEIATDTEANGISSAICSGNPLSCQDSSKNYFITASFPTYNGKLNGQVNIVPGFVGKSDGLNFDIALNKSLGNTGIPCTKDDTGLCIVPIKIGSETPGKLFINGLRISLRSGFTDTAIFKKLQREPEIITKIENKLLDGNTTLSIPLSLFSNFTTPIVSQFLLIPFQVVYGAESDQELIQIFTVTSDQTVNRSIQDTLNLIEKYNSDADIRSILSFLNINLQPTKTTLITLQQELEDFEKTNTTTENKTKKRQEIIDQADQSRKDIPQTFLFKDNVPSLPAIPPYRINREKILPIAERTDDIEQYIMAIQSEADIDTKAVAFKLITFAGTTTEKTFIMRKISTSLPNAFIVEEIPPFIATDASLIDFGENKAKIQVLGTNPLLIKFPLSSGVNTFAYMVEGNVVGQMGSIKTLMVSTEGAAGTSTFHDAVCGDGRCFAYLENEISCPEDCAKKIPWVAIIIVSVILVIGIYYINFYKGVGNIRAIIKRKTLFKTETDKINLINYIQKAMKANSKEKVTHILLSKGWTKKQIDYAFKTVSQIKK